MSFVISGMKDSLFGAGNSAAFGAAGKAMAELGVAGCIGATCVHQDLISMDMIRALSKTTFSILLPMFLGTGIIKAVATYGLTKSSMGIPILAVVHSYMMFLISKHMLLPLLGMNGDAPTVVSCSFGNSGVVPLIFAEALFRQQPDLLAKCYAHISMYLVGWSPFMWSFGRTMLIGSDDDNDKTSDGTQHQDNTLTTRLEALKRLFSPPVVGVMTGLILAISPLRPIFLSTSADRNAPLGVFYNSFQNLGRAANPLALLVLTSSLAMGAGGTSQNVDNTERSSGTVNPLSRWACVSIARFLVSPTLMMIMLKAMTRIGMIESSQTDPMLWFVMLLESCMPPAQNSVLMLQVADRGAEANRMAKFLFSIYTTAMLPVIVIVTMALRAFELA
jgi:predicted permease